MATPNDDYAEVDAQDKVSGKGRDRDRGIENRGRAFIRPNTLAGPVVIGRQGLAGRGTAVQISGAGEELAPAFSLSVAVLIRGCLLVGLQQIVANRADVAPRLPRGDHVG